MIQAVNFTIGNTGSHHDHDDGNDHLVEITNVSATVVASYCSDAFGRTLVNIDPYADTHRYRFHDPTHGCWTTTATEVASTVTVQSQAI